MCNYRNGKGERTYSSYPKGGFSCSKDSFFVNQTLVFQIKCCGKNPALLVAALYQKTTKQEVVK